MQKEEVSDLKYMSIEEIEEAIKIHDTNYTFVDWKNFDKTLGYLKNKRKELVEL